MRCRSTREARKMEHRKAAQHTKNMNSTAADRDCVFAGAAGISLDKAAVVHAAIDLTAGLNRVDDLADDRHLGSRGHAGGRRGLHCREGEELRI